MNTSANPKQIVIGSRGSDLALWQANYTAQQLQEAGYTVEIKIIKTSGDRIQHLSFDKMEGKGFFTKELEEALLNHEIDLAVHSHKDLPTTNPEGLTIGAVSYRETCTETMLIRPEALNEYNLFSIKEGAVVGTSSQRRKSQLRFFRPDLATADLRGNVPTRIQKLLDGNYDAIVLATAGLKRLNLQPEGLIAKEIPETLFVPAPAQGVLAFQIRENDSRMERALATLHRADVLESIRVERTVLNRLDGGCQLPLGVYCEKNGLGFQAYTAIQPLDGSAFKRFYSSAGTADELTERILHTIHQKEDRTVFISRDAAAAAAFVNQLKNAGFTVIAEDPMETSTIEIDHLPFTEWIFFSSPTCVEQFFSQDLIIPPLCSVAAMGSGTANKLREFGVIPAFTGSDNDIEKTAKLFLERVIGNEVFFPIGENSLRSVQMIIENQVKIHERVIYRRIPVKDFSIPEVDIVVLTSPANAEACLRARPALARNIIAMGQSTAQKLREAGFDHVLTPPASNMQSLADLVCGLSH